MKHCTTIEQSLFVDLITDQNQESSIQILSEPDCRSDNISKMNRGRISEVSLIDYQTDELNH